jgi:hypothetical protein
MTKRKKELDRGGGGGGIGHWALSTWNSIWGIIIINGILEIYVVQLYRVFSKRSSGSVFLRLHSSGQDKTTNLQARF